MCVKECKSGTSRNEGPVAENESHRVDEINLFEKFQSIGVGDPRRRWLVDSGATCSIIAERWLSNYKIVPTWPERPHSRSAVCQSDIHEGLRAKAPLPLRSQHFCPEGSE